MLLLTRYILYEYQLSCVPCGANSPLYGGCYGMSYVFIAVLNQQWMMDGFVFFASASTRSTLTGRTSRRKGPRCCGTTGTLRRSSVQCRQAKRQRKRPVGPSSFLFSSVHLCQFLMRIMWYHVVCTASIGWILLGLHIRTVPPSVAAISLRLNGTSFQLFGLFCLGLHI